MALAPWELYTCKAVTVRLPLLPYLSLKIIIMAIFPLYRCVKKKESKRLRDICQLDDAASAEVYLKSVFWVSIWQLSPIHQSSILKVYLHRWWVKLGLQNQNLILVLSLMSPWLNSVISLSLGNNANWLISIFLVAWVRETGPSRTC